MAPSEWSRYESRPSHAHLLGMAAKGRHSQVEWINWNQRVRANISNYITEPWDGLIRYSHRWPSSPAWSHHLSLRNPTLTCLRVACDAHDQPADSTLPPLSQFPIFPLLLLQYRFQEYHLVFIFAESVPWFCMPLNQRLVHHFKLSLTISCRPADERQKLLQELLHVLVLSNLNHLTLIMSWCASQELSSPIFPSW